MKTKQLATLLTELLDYQVHEYRLLYFDIGTEWQMQNAKGWNLWGDQLFESWWSEVWGMMVSHFIDKLRMDADLNPFMEDKTGTFIVSDKSVIRFCFEKYAYGAMLECHANQAIMELAMHRAIKKLNQTKS